MKQTAVEWLVEQINKDVLGQSFLATWKKEFEQAKAMEKEQMNEASENLTEFSERWGLKIEERELSLEERVRLIMDTAEYRNYTEEEWKVYINTTSAPTKLITITYNNETIEVYE